MSRVYTRLAAALNQFRYTNEDRGALMNAWKHFATLSAAAVVVGLCSGCSIGGTDPAGPPSYTGNWQFTGVATNAGQAPTPVSAFVGALASSGSNLTGTFRLVTSNGCVGPFQDVTFTGSCDSFGIAILNSTNLPANPISITLVASPTDSAVGVGSYTIDGAGPCAMPKTTMGSLSFKPLTGTYTGTLVSTGNVSATVTATLTQAPADSDGQFPESGTVTVVTPSCTNTFTATGIVTGPTFSATLNQAVAGIPSTALLLGAITPDATQISIPGGINILSANCNFGSFSGTLHKP